MPRVIDPLGGEAPPLQLGHEPRRPVRMLVQDRYHIKHLS
jgi:hypothetical protein